MAENFHKKFIDFLLNILTFLYVCFLLIKCYCTIDFLSELKRLFLKIENLGQFIALPTDTFDQSFFDKLKVQILCLLNFTFLKRFTVTYFSFWVKHFVWNILNILWNFFSASTNTQL